MNISIQKLDPKNWQKYQALRLEFLKTEPYATGYSYQQEQKLPASKWKAQINQLAKNSLTLVAIDQNTYIGTVSAFCPNSPKQQHIAIIARVYVSSKYRSQGVGKKLLTSLLKELESNPQIKKLNLDVTTTQTPAINLYQKLGFKIVGELKREYFVDGKFYDVYEMEKYI